MNAIIQCIEETVAQSERICPSCGNPFTPRRSWAVFCSSACRTTYDQEHGTEARVAAVRKLKTGVSVVLRLQGPAAERALNLGIGEGVRLVRKP
jgi:hypothetical protein